MFRVQPGAANELHLGDLMLAPVPPAPNDPLEPFIDRVTGSAVVAYLELHSNGKAPRPDAVRVHIAAQGGANPLVSAAAPMAGQDGGWSIARATLPTTALVPGSYVARAEIIVRGSVVARTDRPFTIAP